MRGRGPGPPITRGGLSWIAVAAAAGLAAVSAARLGLPVPRASRARSIPPAVSRAPVRGAFEQAMHSAWVYRMRARLIVNGEMEALDAWDPEVLDSLAPGGIDAETWRLARMAQDPDGDLSRARHYARLAQTRARTQAERWRSTLLLVQIDRELECCPERPEQARQLAAMRPGGLSSQQLLLRQAAQCGGNGALQRLAVDRPHHLARRRQRRRL